MSKTIKAGQVIETYQGKFAKVLSVEGGMYALTAFHAKEIAAEADDVPVKRLNSYGLSQVIKGGKNVPEEKAEEEAAAKAKAEEEAKKAEEEAKKKK